MYIPGNENGGPTAISTSTVDIPVDLQLSPPTSTVNLLVDLQLSPHLEVIYWWICSYLHIYSGSTGGSIAISTYIYSESTGGSLTISTFIYSHIFIQSLPTVPHSCMLQVYWTEIEEQTQFENISLSQKLGPLKDIPEFFIFLAILVHLIKSFISYSVDFYSFFVTMLRTNIFISISFLQQELWTCISFLTDPV